MRAAILAGKGRGKENTTPLKGTRKMRPQQAQPRPLSKMPSALKFGSNVVRPFHTRAAMKIQRDH